MNNCSSSCHLTLVLIWEKSTKPLIALNTDHEQTLNNKKIVPSFSSSRFDSTLTDYIQSRNSRNTVKLDEIFSTDSPPAKFPFNHQWLYSQHISLWPGSNQHSVTTRINKWISQVKWSSTQAHSLFVRKKFLHIN